MSKTYTVDDCMICQAFPEYPRASLDAWWKGRAALTAADILRLDLPFYVVLQAVRTLGAVGQRSWARFAAACVQQELMEYEVNINLQPFMDSVSEWLLDDTKRHYAAVKDAAHDLLDATQYLVKIASTINGVIYPHRTNDVSDIVFISFLATEIVLSSNKTSREWQRQCLLEIIQEEGSR